MKNCFFEKISTLFEFSFPKQFSPKKYYKIALRCCGYFADLLVYFVPFNSVVLAPSLCLHKSAFLGFVYFYPNVICPDTFVLGNKTSSMAIMI